MAGTRQGGLQVRDKVLKRDPDYYKKLGALGGRNSHTGGFYDNREAAQAAGSKGGSNRRGVRKCKVCLTFRRDVTKGICASCQPQDTPELRELLGIDAEGKKLWQPKRSTSSSATSRTSRTTSRRSQSKETSGNGSSTRTSRTRSNVRKGLRKLK